VSFKEYYQGELSALRQQAARLCEQQPSLRAVLGEGARDVEVERLMQGATFLTARLRQKIEDEFPEITHGLIQRLWSNYLRPMPSMSILQFDPAPTRHIPRHCEVVSTAIDGTPCQFRTVFATDVLPLELHRLEHADTGNGAILTLGLRLSTQGHLGEIHLQTLRLHLAGASSISHQLYLNLKQHLKVVRLTPLGKDGIPLSDDAGFAMEPGCVKSVGFDDDQALLDHAASSQKGYRLLQEFFVFHEKFLFVDVTGLDAIKRLDADLLKQAHGFELRFELNHYPRQSQRPTLENIRLYCTPVINLFRHQAAPIELEAEPRDYPVLPDKTVAQTCDVFSVERVIGRKPARSGHRIYGPSVITTQQDPDTALPLYSLSQQPSMMSGGMLTTIRLDADDLQHETLSIDLICTNGDLPQQLAVGDISKCGPRLPGQLTFKNIRPATAAYAPVLEGGQLWKLISNLSLNYLSLESVAALKEILRTYDLPALHDHQSQLTSDGLFSALVKVSHQNIDYLRLGVPVRGTRTLLEIHPENSEREAQWFLFGCALQHFFALYASTHSFNQLHIKSSSGAHWSWTADPGQQPTL